MIMKRSNQGFEMNFIPLRLAAFLFENAQIRDVGARLTMRFWTKNSPGWSSSNCFFLSFFLIYIAVFTAMRLF